MPARVTPTLWTAVYGFEAWAFELVWGDEGICYLGTVDGSAHMARHLQKYWPNALVRSVTVLPERFAGQLQEYFEGVRHRWDLPLALRGTAFQLAVWAAVATVPYGEVRTYGEIARVVGRDRGFRAIGAAVANNPISLIIPCHRVVAAGGGLGGYGGGVDLKARLLAHEALHRAEPSARPGTP